MEEWTLHNSIERIHALCQHGVLGPYKYFEATEIFAFIDGTPVNLFSIFIAHDIPLASGARAPDFLGKRMKLPGFDWKLGICQYTLGIEELVAYLREFQKTKEWRVSGNKLDVGELVAMPPEFVPSESFDVTSVNKLLKNNFSNGSHIFEFFDFQKTKLVSLFETDGTLESLSQMICKVIPIDIGTVSDRLGNCLVQLPVTAAVCQVRSQRYDGGFYIETGWHNEVPARPLTAFLEIFDDGLVSSFRSEIIQGAITDLPMLQDKNAHMARVWDDKHKVLIAAFGRMGFIKGPSGKRGRARAVFSTVAESRFTYVGRDGSIKKAKNKVHSNSRGTAGPHPLSENSWRGKRLYKLESERRRASKEFIAFAGPGHDPAVERQTALETVSSLIEMHGHGGVWLWDPYLDAQDLQDTVFTYLFEKTEVMAITAGENAPDDPNKELNRDDWIEIQRIALEKAAGPLKALNLEFRISRGPDGWKFHDRFLIFPGALGGPLAWSLGTSVNQLGKRFHIMQKVHDGTMMAYTFRQLWTAISGSEYLIWKSR